MLGLEHFHALDQIYCGAQGPRWLRPVIHAIGFVGFAWLFVATESHTGSGRWKLAVLAGCAIVVEIINQVSWRAWRNGSESAWKFKCPAVWALVLAGVGVYLGDAILILLQSPLTIVTESTFTSVYLALLTSWCITFYSLSPHIVWWLPFDPAFEPTLREDAEATRGQDEDRIW